MLQVPTDRPGSLDTAVQILEDWAHLVQMESEEIDKERGVVIEEWRLGRGAMARMRDIQFPILFHKSRYAERLPIGKVEVLENFKYEALRRFYYTWYQPELMAVVAVGDFDISYVDSLIQHHFANLMPRPDRISRTLYNVPDHSETLFAVATDPEATGSTVGVFYKHPVFVQKKLIDYRTILVQILYNTMFNQRLQELLQQVDPPFLYAYSTKSQIVRSKAFYLLGAGVKGSEFERALETLLIEAKRVRQFGFTDSELKRAKQEMLRSIEKAFLERDKTNSPRFAAEYIRNFLQQEPIPGVGLEFEMHKQFLPTIQLTEINKLASEWISDSNRVVLLSGPENNQIKIPTEKELADVFNKVKQTNVKAFTDKVADRPLFDQNIEPGTILIEKQIDTLDVLDWQLSNGVRVILKRTDFQNDEVRFTAMSPGGHSLVLDSDYIAAMTASTLIQQSGINGLDQIELEKLLSGKILNVYPYVGELQEGLSGSSSPRDLETLFQIIHLYFTEPRIDSTVFQSYITRMKGMLENRDASPEVIFNDTIQVTMSQSHFRRRPWKEEMFAEMDMQKSLDIYSDRFADASDFIFIFVGNLEMDTMRNLATTYLGSLPALNRNETWANLKIKPPRGVIKKTVTRGLEPKARVQINFTGTFTWSPENRYKLNAMASVLRIKLREVLREDKGGTYGVGVNAFTSRIPEQRYRILITFGCDPERVEELINEVYDQIDSLKAEFVKNIYLNKVKQSQLRQRQKNLKENNFWLNQLGNYYFYQEDPRDIFKFEPMVEALSETDIQSQAKQFLDESNVITFILLPSLNPCSECQYQ
jgi:zinc protease